MMIIHIFAHIGNDVSLFLYIFTPSNQEMDLGCPQQLLLFQCIIISDVCLIITAEHK